MSRPPKISVIVLNYNGRQWIPPCLESLGKQTIFADLEIILTDNKSSDGSEALAAEWLARRGAGRVVQNGANLGYCEANNNGAAVARGKYLLFLNNDTWLEPDCLERLFDEVEAVGADAATPQGLALAEAELGAEADPIREPGETDRAYDRGPA